jgi:hypothetical protein
MKSSLYLLFLIGLSISSHAAPITEGSARAEGLTNAVRAIVPGKRQDTARSITNDDASDKGVVLEFDIGDVPLRLPGGEPDKIAHVPK